MRWFRRSKDAGAGMHHGGDAAIRAALLAVLERDWERAEKLLSRAARLDSDDIDAYLALARVFRQRGEVGRSIHIHQNLLLRPDLGREARRTALAELAADFQKGGFLRRAIASFEEVLGEDKKHRAALSALTRLYRDVRQFESAIEVERRLARLDQRDVSDVEAHLWVDIADVARSDGRMGDARRALKKALRRDPRCVRAWIALGDVEAERGRTRASLSAWRKVPDLDRHMAIQVYPRLGAALTEAGRGEEHERDLVAWVALDPDDSGARLALARVLAARGATEDALAELHRLIERVPEDLEAHGAAGRVLLAEHRDPDAVKAYAELLEVLDRAGLLRPRESSR
jgi:lipopolysaccharide biosynthesis regulator YciM